MLYHTDGDQTAGKTVIPWLFHVHNYSLQRHLSSFFFICATKPYSFFLPANGIFPYNVCNVRVAALLLGTILCWVGSWDATICSFLWSTFVRDTLLSETKRVDFESTALCSLYSVRIVSPMTAQEVDKIHLPNLCTMHKRTLQFDALLTIMDCTSIARRIAASSCGL